MTQPLKYETNEPITHVIDFLEKTNNDKLASDVLDVYAKFSTSKEQYNLLAKMYLDIRNIPQAEKYALKVYTLAETHDEIFNSRANLGKMYNNTNEPEKSLFYSELNRIVKPDDPDTLLESVFSLYLLNRKLEAEQILIDLKAREDTLNEHHRDIVDFNLGTYKLEHGDFHNGMKGFMVQGKKLKLWFSHRELPYKFWDGGIFPGKTIILFAEGGGIGDEMLSVRYMDDLKAVGMNPIYYTSRKDLYDIFNRCGYETIMDFKDIDTTDIMWTFFMQPPIWLNSKAEDVGRYDSYLYPSKKAIEKWAFLGQSKNKKIGIKFQGNKKNERDLHRNVPLSNIIDALHEMYPNMDNVEFYSLQLDDGSEEVKNYPEIIDYTDKIKSYDDTFAILQHMDYIITSCTSTLHAAAILGVKTLALIPISAYFTWVSPPLPNRPENTSIWYGDNLRLFRQVKPRCWKEPLEELKNYVISERLV